MKINVNTLLENIMQNAPVGLFSEAVTPEINRLAGFFADFSASEYIVETSLENASSAIDVSFRVLREEADHMREAFKSEAFAPLTKSVYWQKLMKFCNEWPDKVNEIWFELDQSAYEKSRPEPCFFFDSESIKNAENQDFSLLKLAAESFLDNAAPEKVYDQLLANVRLFPSELPLFHVGSMLARHQDRLRVFTSGMSWEELLKWSQSVNWQESPPDLEKWQNILYSYNAGPFIADFDVTEQGVPSKLGINYVTAPEKNDEFLALLKQQGLCSNEKAEIIKAWCGKRSEFINNAGFCMIINRVCHYKMTLTANGPVKMKVYLQTLVFPFSQLIKKHEEQKTMTKSIESVWRAEPEKLLVYPRGLNSKMIINESGLDELKQWLVDGKTGICIDHLIKQKLLPEFREATPELIQELKHLIEQTRHAKAPKRSMSAPEIINLEVTTRCPLRCPQCFCDLEAGKDLDLQTAIAAINEAAALKIPVINFSGGETLAYPHIETLIKTAHSLKISSSIAISGWSFTPEKLESLISAGVTSIFVSLNGSTPAVNQLSRDGYDYATSAIQLLAEKTEINRFINWVARNDNVDDFPELVKMALQSNFNGVVIIENKPDVNGTVQSVLCPEKLAQLAGFIRKYRQENHKMIIEVEACFSPLRAMLSQTWIGNSNTGFFRGCGAGRDTAALDVDGNWIPCRHIIKPERFPSLSSYWHNSQILDQLREHEENRDPRCLKCRFLNNCLPCRAAPGNYPCAL
ncbi:MAG: radical SAM protein [Candidatus Riflebacteria bacterium]|nr:radical SAM protein [Candidatus Riflebacteria bacterium]